MKAGRALYRRCQRKYCAFCTNDYTIDALCDRCRKDILDGARAAHKTRAANKT